jgi:hypothetical protein
MKRKIRIDYVIESSMCAERLRKADTFDNANWYINDEGILFVQNLDDYDHPVAAYAKGNWVRVKELEKVDDE